MKKSWIIPAVALLVAALVNFVARWFGNAAVAAIVKPALLPLIALTTVAAAGGMESRTIRLLVIAAAHGVKIVFAIVVGLNDGHHLSVDTLGAPHKR